MSIARGMLPLLSLGAILGGCAPEGGYPSLRPRAVEQAGAAALPVRPTPAPPAPDPALDAQVAALGQATDAAQTGFETEAAAAEPLVGRGAGAAVGSEPWVLAQQGLARLAAAREPLTRVLVQLDGLRIAQEEQRGGVDTTALDAAWTRASALQQDQLVRYEALAARLASAS